MSLDDQISVKITRRELDQLDDMITLFEAMADYFCTDYYDQAWNLRNSMVPFVSGDLHFDEEMPS